MPLFNALCCLCHRATPPQEHGPTPAALHHRRRRAYHPTVEALEARLPLGDALLSSVAGWWLGSSLLPLATQLRAPDEPFSPAWEASSLAESSNVERRLGSPGSGLAPAGERLPAPVKHSESAGPQAEVFCDALPAWQPHQPEMGRPFYQAPAVAPTPFALSLPSAGGTAASLIAATSTSPSGSTTGGVRLSTPGRVGSSTVSPSAASPRLHDFGRTPLSFEVNQGQTAAQVQYLAHGPGYTVFLTSTEAVLALRPGQPASDRSALASISTLPSSLTKDDREGQE
jgi:hypothetical protein